MSHPHKPTPPPPQGLPTKDITVALWDLEQESGRGTQTFRHLDRGVPGRMLAAMIVPLERKVSEAMD